MDDGGEHPVTAGTILSEQLFGASNDLTKISVVRDYAMLDNLCNSRTQFPKWKSGKDLRVNHDGGRKMKSAHQILPGEGVDPRLAADRGVDHCHQGGGHLDNRDAPHESGSDEARQVAHDTPSEGDDGGVPTVAFGEHLVGQTGPGIPGLVGLAGRYHEYGGPVLFESFHHSACVPVTDVGIGDYSVAVGRGDVARDLPNLGKEAGGDPDRAPQLGLVYQVTSPAPVRTFATRASMKRRSESRFR